MTDQGSGSAAKSQLISQVTFGTVIHDALREAEGFRPGMRSQPMQVRFWEVAHTTINLINLIQRQPQCNCLHWLNHEVMPVLMGRSRLADHGTFVEVLQVFSLNGFPQQMFRNFLKRAVDHQSVEKGIMHM